MSTLKTIDFSRYRTKKHFDFCFHCTDGDLYFSRYLLTICNYFANMFDFGGTEERLSEMTVDYPISVVEQIIAYLDSLLPRPVRKKELFKKNKSSVLALTHMWDITQLVPYIRGIMLKNPKEKYISVFQLYFDNEYIGRLVRQLIRKNIAITSIDKDIETKIYQSVKMIEIKKVVIYMIRCGLTPTIDRFFEDDLKKLTVDDLLKIYLLCEKEQSTTDFVVYLLANKAHKNDISFNDENDTDSDYIFYK